MARQIEAALGNAGNWRIAFEDGLRGFAARISTLTTSLQLLDKPFDIPATESSPEQWAIDTDQRIAEIFFGMDSALECFVFALNAIGYLKSPSDFCDITTRNGLRQICPNNIASKNAHDKINPRPGYGKYFPRVVACWSARSELICEVITYHDVSKHRSCIVHTSSRGSHSLPVNPKSPNASFHAAAQTVEDIARDFHRFCESLLIETVEEISSVFGIAVTRVDHS
jgi:hypothetical protein